jgi:predicted ATPase
MLTPISRQLLACAALTGERSWENLVLELANVSSKDPLNELLENNLLIKEPVSSIPEESEYRFQSELLRRAVLRMIPFSDRPLLHLRIASWLEKHAPLVLSALVGHHFKEGRSHEAAYPHYLAAADLAISEQDPETAYQLFDTLLALELPPKLLAEGALAYTQAALSQCHRERALEQLNAADQWIEMCPEDSRDELRQVHIQFYQDLKPSS